MTSRATVFPPYHVQVLAQEGVPYRFEDLCPPENHDRVGGERKSVAAAAVALVLFGEECYCAELHLGVFKQMDGHLRFASGDKRKGKQLPVAIELIGHNLNLFSR